MDLRLPRDATRLGRIWPDQSVDGRGLRDFFELLPFAVNLFDPDGTSVFVNQAWTRMFDQVSAGCGYLLDPKKVVGSYNILSDRTVSPSRLAGWMEAFSGRTVTFPSVGQPVALIRQNHRLDGLDVVSLSQDVTAFPVFDQSEGLAYVAAIMITRQAVRGRAEIARAIAYLEANWREPFNAAAAADAAGFSTRHFAREFRKYVGLSPHEYQLRYRMARLRETLCDPALSVSQAFAACGMDYSGWLARLFRERTGLTPSEFRRQAFASPAISARPVKPALAKSAKAVRTNQTGQARATDPPGASAVSISDAAR
ncbi:MAG: AraC family transcriptional regulator [Bifidobacteriaceae bacterium]|jgi:AraC-like DNA-binding protein|nr:AraC family transcriptional regulator [Bifidobacteriaceae bacterium]